MIYQNVSELIGNTPIVALPYEGAQIYAKCEFLNPSGSLKDRIALAMIKGANLADDSIIIEPTSGNTGIALAQVCASLNIKLILTMPSSMSIERQKLLEALGAQVMLSEADLAMQGAVELAQKIARQTPNAVILSQFENKNNPKAHEQTTAQEILQDLPDLDVFVMGVGTGGTITGIARVLKRHNPKVKIIAVEPSTSAVLSGKSISSHAIEGIGAGFIPKTLDLNLIDEIITVSDEQAIAHTKELVQKYGLLVGISSGANFCASKKVLTKSPKTKVLTILCDSYMRYLSKDL